MTFAAEVGEKLVAPLDPNRVRHREGGGGKSLSYLEGHDVIRAANDIFGIGGWGYTVQDLFFLGEEPFERNNRKGIRVAYRATVRVEVNGVQYGDVGYGDAQEYTGSVLTPHELAAKEAVTDAMKRCMRNLGDQFGLCLYDKLAPEHDGGTASAGSVSARGASVGSSAPAPSDGKFRFASGKYQGKALDEVPASYLDWYLENGPRDDVKLAINMHREFSGDAAPDDGIPF